MPLAYSAPTTLPALVPATTVLECAHDADVREAPRRAAAERQSDPDGARGARACACACARAETGGGGGSATGRLRRAPALRDRAAVRCGHSGAALATGPGHLGAAGQHGQQPAAGQQHAAARIFASCRWIRAVTRGGFILPGHPGILSMLSFLEREPFVFAFAQRLT